MNFPFRLTTGDQNLTAMANAELSDLVADETITLRRPGTADRLYSRTPRREIKKSFVFRGEQLRCRPWVTFRQNGQVVPNTKLAIGASIGDHAINHHTFYQIEAETVARIDGDISRHQGYYSFEYDANNQASLSDSGMVDWAGVGDAYFAMTAIPAAPQQGLEYRAFKYDVQTQPFYDSIFSWVIRSPKTSETRHLVTAYLPIPADGSINKIFTGAKDYSLLSELSGDYLFSEPNGSLKAADGRAVSIVDLINFSNYSWLRLFVKPLSIPSFMH